MSKTNSFLKKTKIKSLSRSPKQKAAAATQRVNTFPDEIRVQDYHNTLDTDDSFMQNP